MTTVRALNAGLCIDIDFLDHEPAGAYTGRSMDYTIEGQMMLNAFDIASEAGGVNRALVRDVEVNRGRRRFTVGSHTGRPGTPPVWSFAQAEAKGMCLVSGLAPGAAGQEGIASQSSIGSPATGERSTRSSPRSAVTRDAAVRGRSSGST
jgi:hypothetical protein